MYICFDTRKNNYVVLNVIWFHNLDKHLTLVRGKVLGLGFGAAVQKYTLHISKVTSWQLYGQEKEKVYTIRAKGIVWFEFNECIFVLVHCLKGDE